MKAASRSLKSLALIFAGVLALSVIGCSRSTPQRAQNERVRLSTSKNAWCSLVLIADANGYFAQEGANVELSYTDGGRYCLDALLSRSADLGTIVELNLSFLGFTGNSNVAVVANIVKSTGMSIVARKTSGISVFQDLKGKSLAFTPGTQGDIFANRVFAKNGLSLTDVEVQKLQPKALAPAIGSGAVDAVSTWEPFAYACVKALGTNSIVFRDPEAHTGYLHLAARKEWAEKHSESLSSILRALRRAEQFAIEHPTEAQAVLAKAMNADREDVSAIWPYYQMNVTMDTNELLRVITACGELIQQTQPEYASKPLPDYSTYIDSKYFNK